MFGQYAQFIIPAYVISFLALAVAALVISQIHKTRKAELERLISKNQPDGS